MRYNTRLSQGVGGLPLGECVEPAIAGEPASVGVNRSDETDARQPSIRKSVELERGNCLTAACHREQVARIRLQARGRQQFDPRRRFCRWRRMLRTAVERDLGRGVVLEMRSVDY